MRADRTLRVCAVSLILLSGVTAAHADVVAIKRNPGVMDTYSNQYNTVSGNLNSVFKNAIANSTIVVYSGNDPISDSPRAVDAALGPTSGYRYLNYGASTGGGVSSGTSVGLYKFDLTTIPGLINGTINVAELRLQTNNGNSGTKQLAQVLTHDWIEGTKNGGYPGAAGGVTGANPIGYNTGGSSSPTWGPGSNADFSSADYGTLLSHKSQSGVGDLYFVWDVTDIVKNWAEDGEDNFGFARVDSGGNWAWRFSEFSDVNGIDAEPVLFIDFEPFVAPPPAIVPEPASLAIWSVVGLFACAYGYRRRRVARQSI